MCVLYGRDAVEVCFSAFVSGYVDLVVSGLGICIAVVFISFSYLRVEVGMVGRYSRGDIDQGPCLRCPPVQ